MAVLLCATAIEKWVMKKIKLRTKVFFNIAIIRWNCAIKVFA